MAGYSGIHVEHPDPRAVAEVLAEFERSSVRLCRWLNPKTQEIDRLINGKLFCRYFGVSPLDSGWVEIQTGRWAWSLRKYANYLSRSFHCRVFAFGYQSTAGQSISHLSSNGHTIRSILNDKETIHETGEYLQEGQPLDFEIAFRDRVLNCLEEELKPGEEYLPNEITAMTVMDCEQFAKEADCPSYEYRRAYDIAPADSRLLLKSSPYWWPF